MFTCFMLRLAAANLVWMAAPGLGALRAAADCQQCGESRLIFQIAAMVVVSLLAALGWFERRALRREKEHAARLELFGRRFNQLSEHSRTVIWEHDSNGLYTYLSPSSELVYGYRPEELVGKKYYYELCPESCRDQFIRETQAIIARGEAVRDYRNQVVTRSGAVIWVMTHAFPFRDAQGRILGYRGSDMDVTRLHQAEEELRRIKRRFEQIAEHSRTMVWETDANGLYTYASGAVELITGHTPADLVGRRHFYDLFPEGVREEFKALALADFDRRKPFVNFENPVQRPDGEVVWVATNGLPVLDGKGVLLGYQGCDTDITARRKVEESLRRREIHLNTLVNSIPDLVWLKDPNGVYLDCNRRFESFFGVSSACIVGKTDYDFIPASLADFFRGHDCNAIANGRPTVNEETVTFASDGHVEHLETIKTPMLDDSGRLIGVLGVGHDINERKRIENALRESQEQLKLISDNLPGGMVYQLDFGVDGSVRRFTYLSAGVEKLYHLTAAEGLADAEAVYSKILPEDRAVLADRENEAAATLSRLSVEFRVRDPSGEIRWHQAVASPRRLSDRRLIWEGFHLDTTGRKRAEEIIVRFNEKLKLQAELARELAERSAAAAAAKSQLVANVSHELRTPINGIIGPSEMLLEMELDPLASELAAMINSSGRHLLELVNGILDFSSADSGRLSVSLHPIHLRPFLSEALAPFQLKAKAQHLDFQCHVRPDVPEKMMLDGFRVRQVLGNLVGNAIKFTERGQVSVEVALEPSSPKMLRVSVRDTGIGLDPDAIDRLFEPFVQADDSDTRRFSGCGLGLAIAKRLVELMGGRIGGDGRPGEGAEFWFEIPHIEAEADPTPCHPERPAARRMNLRSKSLRILLADDDPVSRKIACLALNRFGVAQVDQVGNGREAVERLGQRKYDLVFMDCKMPVMDGYAATSFVRDPGSPVIDHETLIIAMTANAMREDRGKILAAGMNDVVVKPIRLEDLHLIFNKWFP